MYHSTCAVSMLLLFKWHRLLVVHEKMDDRLHLPKFPFLKISNNSFTPKSKHSGTSVIGSTSLVLTSIIFVNRAKTIMQTFQISVSECIKLDQVWTKWTKLFGGKILRFLAGTLLGTDTILQWGNESLVHFRTSLHIGTWLLHHGSTTGHWSCYDFFECWQNVRQTAMPRPCATCSTSRIWHNTFGIDEEYHCQLSNGCKSNWVGRVDRTTAIK